MNRQIKILIVDDHQLVRVGIKRLLDDVKNFKVVAEASTGEDAVDLVRQTQPDVVLMDASMPGIGGLEATKKILRINPAIKVIVVSSHTEEPYPSRFLQAGAVGYLTKGTPLPEMVEAVTKVSIGQRYLTPEIAQKIALQHITCSQESPLEELSEREMQVMMMITSGQKVQDISDTLCLSPKTVNTYRYRLYKKLNVENDVELTHIAIRHGLLSASDLK